MTIERDVAQHYEHRTIEDAILKGLAAAGKNPERPTVDDLAPADEFHNGGRQATVEFAEQMGVRPGMSLLDIGCGLGGASRYFAHAHGCRVSGIDLTEEYVRVAESLSRRVGLGDRVSYYHASALALPFEDGAFDGAYMLHVGMNIEDKQALFVEVRRVLTPGGVFGVYDVMREGDGDFSYPVPWASSPTYSFVESLAAYKRYLTLAGFTLRTDRNLRAAVVDSTTRVRARPAEGGPPALGLHLVMGPTAPQKRANLRHALEQGILAPIEVFCQAA